MVNQAALGAGFRMVVRSTPQWLSIMLAVGVVDFSKVKGDPLVAIAAIAASPVERPLRWLLQTWLHEKKSVAFFVAAVIIGFMLWLGFGVGTCGAVGAIAWLSGGSKELPKGISALGTGAVGVLHPAAWCAQGGALPVDNTGAIQ